MKGNSSGRLSGKRAIITGASGNIGAATAEIFAREGASIVIGDLDPAAQGTVDRIVASGGTAHFILTDVSDAESMKNLIDEAATTLGGLDILVNNAGIQRSGHVTELSVTDWDKTFAVNARSCFLGARFAIPHLRKASGGTIVNMASTAGFRAPAGLSAYAASKGAIITFTRTLASELGADGIRVNAVCPGWIDTSFNQPVIDQLGGREAQANIVKAGVPLGRQGEPHEVGEVIAFLASDAASYINAQAIAIDGGAS